ncbi:MAG: transcriptional initiation protein Tat, partial [Myxococcales bacterium]|nr:transcriptional initiation protein Tat [Myxococcales bacterium]
HFIFCYFQGGWDILLSLDPRDPARFNEANMAQTLIQPGYQLLVGAPGGGAPIDVGGGRMFGPYIGGLAQHMDVVSVIRGMSMDTLTHEVGRRRFLTGKPPSGLLARGSSGATWLASRLGSEELIPQIAVNVESYNVDQPTWASALKVAGVGDLTRALTAGPDALDPRVEDQIDALLAQHAD